VPLVDHVSRGTANLLRTNPIRTNSVRTNITTVVNAKDYPNGINTPDIAVGLVVSSSYAIESCRCVGGSLCILFKMNTLTSTHYVHTKRWRKLLRIVFEIFYGFNTNIVRFHLILSFKFYVNKWIIAIKFVACWVKQNKPGVEQMLNGSRGYLRTNVSMAVQDPLEMLQFSSDIFQRFCLAAESFHSLGIRFRFDDIQNFRKMFLQAIKTWKCFFVV
jgi:hypothetical protein